MEARFRQEKIDHDEKYQDYKDKKRQQEESGGGGEPELPFQMDEATHLEQLEAKYSDEHQELLGVHVNSRPSEIVGAALIRLTPAIVWGGIGLILATVASVWSLYV
jgi:hypothetical protein